MAQKSKHYRRGSSAFRVRTPSLTSTEADDTEEESVEDAFLRFLDHPEHYKKMRKFLNSFPQYKHDFDFVCAVCEFKREEDPGKRYKQCKTILTSYICSGYHNNRKRPKHDISLSPMLLSHVADEVWEYRGGKRTIPTYIFEEPFDVVSSLLARRVFGLYQRASKSSQIAFKAEAAKQLVEHIESFRRTESREMGRPSVHQDRHIPVPREAESPTTKASFGVTSALNFVTSMTRKVLYEGETTESRKAKALLASEGRKVKAQLKEKNLRETLGASFKRAIKSEKMQAQHQPGIYKQGWMYKKGGTRRNWSRRWFILKHDVLQYYEAPESMHPRGTILLEKMIVSHAPKATRTKYPNAFQIFDPHDKSILRRIYYVHCANSVGGREEKAWVGAIKLGCERASGATTIVPSPQPKRANGRRASGADSGEEENKTRSARLVKIRERRRQRRLMKQRAEERGADSMPQPESSDGEEGMGAGSASSSSEVVDDWGNSDDERVDWVDQYRKRRQQNFVSDDDSSSDEEAYSENEGVEGSEDEGESQGEVVKFDENSSLRTIIKAMDDCSEDFEIQATACTVLRQKVSEMEGELGRRERQHWTRAISLMSQNVFQFSAKPDVLVPVACCLSRLVKLDSVLRETIFNNGATIAQVRLGADVVVRSDHRKAYRVALTKLRQAELDDQNDTFKNRSRSSSSSAQTRLRGSSFAEHRNGRRRRSKIKNNRGRGSFKDRRPSFGRTRRSSYDGGRNSEYGMEYYGRANKK